jgi:multiple sugar transport system substrate-binding protein
MGRDRDEDRRLGAARIRAGAAACVLVLAALVATGCGGSADDADAAGVPTLGFMTSRDQTGTDDKVFDYCAKKSGGKYRIEGIPVGPSTDAAREQITRRLAARDQSIDLLNLDVIWTAEFSDAGWLVDITDRVEQMGLGDKFVRAPLESAHYKGKYWGIPSGTDVSLLYYRTDLIKTPPKTWEDLVVQAKAAQAKKPGIAGFIFQGNSYEGGTVDALEFIHGAGANVIDEDGKKAVISKGDGATYALTFLRKLFTEGISPKVVTTYMEEDTRMAFQNGDAVFMRNWPYAYALMGKDEASKVKGKFAVAPLPGFEGRGRANVLGGQNFGIASTSKHPELAFDAIMCMNSEYVQKLRARNKGQAPTLQSLYKDPALLEEFPHLKTVAEGLEVGLNRPVTPYYNDVTIVIYRFYNEVLNGRVDPQEAVDEMDHKIQKAIVGKAEI